MELSGKAIPHLRDREGSGRVERERARYNGATGVSDMAGKAAKVAVESSGSERDTNIAYDVDLTCHACHLRFPWARQSLGVGG
ncbi:MAG TPA: hypothetical protein VJ420_03290 [Candidatus Udaeobacter sp.]|nr:hypothetical protein [Candidatus Udaeobacter sp.]